MARMLVYSVVDRREAGGAQAVIARLLDSLRHRGHAVMEAWAGPGPVRGLRERAVLPADEWICPLHVRSTRRAEQRRRWHIPSLLRLAAGLARRRPDIVNVHFISEQTLYFLLLSRIFGYRTVLSAHGSDIMAPDPRWRDFLPEFLTKADAVTVVSRLLAEKVLAIPGIDPTKVHVIPNGIDTEFWSPGGARRVLPFPTIVAVGRLEPVKGFDVLIEAFGRIRRTLPEARLVLIGEGSRRGELEAQARAMGLGQVVRFAGQQGKEEIRETLRHAGVYALTSRSEGMPLALLEAMACGVPVVATRVGGVPEVLTEGTGLLVPPDDTEALAEAMTRVLSDTHAADRLGAAAVERAQSFSSAESEAAYERLYRSLTTA